MTKTFCAVLKAEKEQASNLIFVRCFWEINLFKNHFTPYVETDLWVCHRSYIQHETVVKYIPEDSHTLLIHSHSPEVMRNCGLIKLWLISMVIRAQGTQLSISRGVSSSQVWNCAWSLVLSMTLYKQKLNPSLFPQCISQKIFMCRQMINVECLSHCQQGWRKMSHPFQTGLRCGSGQITFFFFFVVWS